MRQPLDVVYSMSKYQQSSADCSRFTESQSPIFGGSQMSTERGVATTIARSTLISIASLFIGCSESGDGVNSAAQRDSSAAESSVPDAAVDAQSSHPSTEVTIENAAAATPTEDPAQLVPSTPRPTYLQFHPNAHGFAQKAAYYFLHFAPWQEVS